MLMNSGGGGNPLLLAWIDAWECCAQSKRGKRALNLSFSSSFQGISLRMLEMEIFTPPRRKVHSEWRGSVRWKVVKVWLGVTQSALSLMMSGVPSEKWKNTRLSARSPLCLFLVLLLLQCFFFCGVGHLAGHDWLPRNTLLSCVTAFGRGVPGHHRTRPPYAHTHTHTHTTLLKKHLFLL